MFVLIRGGQLQLLRHGRRRRKFVQQILAGQGDGERRADLQFPLRHVHGPVRFRVDQPQPRRRGPLQELRLHYHGTTIHLLTKRRHQLILRYYLVLIPFHTFPEVQVTSNKKHMKKKPIFLQTLASSGPYGPFLAIQRAFNIRFCSDFQVF